MYECHQKLNQYLTQHEYVKAEYELRKLENGLNLQEPENQRLTLQLQAALDGMQKRITSEEKLELLYKALGEDAADRDSLRTRSLLREEVLVWNNIAVALEELGRRPEGIAIYQDIRTGYENSMFGPAANKKEYLLILSNMVGFLGREGNYEDAINASEIGIRCSLEWEEGTYLAVFLYMNAWIKEKLSEAEGEEAMKKACLSTYGQAFRIAFMIKHRYYKQRIQEHCVQYYEISFK